MRAHAELEPRWELNKRDKRRSRREATRAHAETKPRYDEGWTELESRCGEYEDPDKHRLRREATRARTRSWRLAGSTTTSGWRRSKVGAVAYFEPLLSSE